MSEDQSNSGDEFEREPVPQKSLLGFKNFVGPDVEVGLQPPDHRLGRRVGWEVRYRNADGSSRRHPAGSAARRAGAGRR